MGNGLKRAKAAANREVFRQAVVWVPHGEPGVPNTVALPEKPSRVWTLLTERVAGEPPRGLSSTPKAIKGSEGLAPVHGRNAFLEDPIHDWTWSAGRLRYFSRITTGNVWVLCEYGV